jgi:hypothetical protein
MSYRFVTDESQPHLGGNIIEGDPLTHSPRVWDYMIERFALRSVMDLGSGLGHAAWYFNRKGIAAVAVDGLLANMNASVYPTVLHDLSYGPIRTNVDLVVCIETVEHIKEEHLDKLLLTLSWNSEVTIISHASPDQGGYHHVNLQNDEYWIAHMRRFGSVLLDIDTQRVRFIAKAEGAEHLARSGLVFSNHKGLPEQQGVKH